MIAQRTPFVSFCPACLRSRATEADRPSRRRGVIRGSALGAVGWLALVACNPRTPVVASAPPPAASTAVAPPAPASVPSPARAPDARPPTYANPVIPGTTPDPSAVRVGDDYYLVTSSFEYFPGVPLYHSRDLVHWRQLGHVLSRDAQLPLRGIPSSQGIYAPTIRHHDGTYYVVTTNMQGGGSFYVKATAPTGPWSDPIFVREGEFTMDPSLFFDDDGKVYYTRHGGGREGGIYQAEIDVATGVLRAPARLVWKGTGDIWPEGPHLYKVDGTYYLMISEGGTSYEHMVTVARAKSPWGPFEPAPRNPILTHRFLPEHPLQATGHADLLQTPEGRFWLVLLGIRPSTPRRHHLGRETLSPVSSATTAGRWSTAGARSSSRCRPRGCRPGTPGRSPRPATSSTAPRSASPGSTSATPSERATRSPRARAGCASPAAPPRSTTSPHRRWWWSGSGTTVCGSPPSSTWP